MQIHRYSFLIPLRVIQHIVDSYLFTAISWLFPYISLDVNTRGGKLLQIVQANPSFLSNPLQVTNNKQNISLCVHSICLQAADL